VARYRPARSEGAAAAARLKFVPPMAVDNRPAQITRAALARWSRLPLRTTPTHVRVAWRGVPSRQISSPSPERAIYIRTAQITAGFGEILDND